MSQQHEQDASTKSRRPAGTGSVLHRKGSRIWQIQYFDAAGRRHRESSHTASFKRASDKLKDRLLEVAAGTLSGPKIERTTVAELADDLQRDYRINERRSLSDLQARWRLHLEPFFGRMKARDVTKDILRRYVDHRQSQHASNSTINRELAALKRMLNLGRGDKVMHLPPFPHLAEHNIRVGFLERHEYDKLAAAASHEGLWMRGMFETGYRIGWRISELQDLKVAQVDLLHRRVHLWPEQTKNRRGRTAPMDEPLYLWLSQCVLGKDDDRYVFSRDEDGCRRVGDVRDAWARICVATGLGKMLCRVCKTPIADGKCPACGKMRSLKEQTYHGLIFHDLRRTAVRNLVRGGVPERIAMAITGHLTRSVFDRYDIVNEGDLDTAAQKMNQMNRPSPQFDTQSLRKQGIVALQAAAARAAKS